jgi:hypothetical protein
MAEDAPDQGERFREFGPYKARERPDLHLTDDDQQWPDLPELLGEVRGLLFDWDVRRSEWCAALKSDRLLCVAACRLVWALENGVVSLIRRRDDELKSLARDFLRQAGELFHSQRSSKSAFLREHGRRAALAYALRVKPQVRNFIESARLAARKDRSLLEDKVWLDKVASDVNALVRLHSWGGRDGKPVDRADLKVLGGRASANTITNHLLHKMTLSSMQDLGNEAPRRRPGLRKGRPQQ